MNKTRNTLEFTELNKTTRRQIKQHLRKYVKHRSNLVYENKKENNNAGSQKQNRNENKRNKIKIMDMKKVIGQQIKEYFENI